MSVPTTEQHETYKAAEIELKDLIDRSRRQYLRFSVMNDSANCITLMAEFKLTPLWGEQTESIMFPVGDDIVLELISGHATVNYAFKFALLRAVIQILKSELAL